MAQQIPCRSSNNAARHIKNPHAKQTQAIVTIEEHNIRGGLGSAIAEALMKTKVPIVSVGVQDRFGQSAKSYEELLQEYGLTAEAVYEAAKEVVALK